MNLLQVADAFVLLLFLVRAPVLWPSNCVIYFAGHLNQRLPQSNLPSLYPWLREGDRHHLVLEHSLDANVVGLFRISRGKRVIGGARQLGGVGMRKEQESMGKRRQRQQGGVTEEQMRPGSLWGRLLAANFSHETSRSSIFGHRFKNKRGTVLSDRRTDRWTYRWTGRSVDEQFYFSNKLFIRKNRMELFINGCETTLLLLLFHVVIVATAAAAVAVTAWSTPEGVLHPQLLC